MNRLFVVFSLLYTMMLAHCLEAQNLPSYWLVYSNQVKANAIATFEDNLQNINQTFSSMDSNGESALFSTPWFVFSDMQTANYTVIIPFENFTALQQLQKDWKKLMASDNMRSMMQKDKSALNNYTAFVLESAPELSYYPADEDSVVNEDEYYLVEVMQVTPGTEAFFESTMKKWVTGFTENNVQYRWNTYRVCIGENMPAYVLVAGARTIQDFKKHMMVSIEVGERDKLFSGSGLAGLATAWHILSSPQKPKDLVLTIYDSTPLHLSSSYNILGILHRYSDSTAKGRYREKEAFDAALSLFDHVANFSRENFISYQGVLRLSSRPKQSEAFYAASRQSPKLTYLNQKEVERRTEGLITTEGLFIEEGLTVDMKAYLSSLKALLCHHGALFQEQKITSLQELKEDRIVICTGANTPKFLPEETLYTTKGQVLQYNYPNIPKLAFPIAGKANLCSYQNSLFLGSTYERNHTHAKPDMAQALDLLHNSIIKFYPFLTTQKPIACIAGERLTTPNRLPLAKRVGDNTWVLSALGSKGLLYHSLLGQEIAEQILTI